MGKLVQKLNRLLPFVAIGTIADCQSILEKTNRSMVKLGIKMITNGNHGLDGICALMQETGIWDKITDSGYLFNSQDIGFTLSPILNASGRITHAQLSINTLLAGETVEKSAFAISNFAMTGNSTSFARDLIAVNEERKKNVASVVENVQIQADKQIEMGNRLIWLVGPWNKGLIGLIASKMVNKHNLPTVVISSPSQKEQLTEEEILELKTYIFSD